MSAETIIGWLMLLTIVTPITLFIIDILSEMNSDRRRR